MPPPGRKPASPVAAKLAAVTSAAPPAPRGGPLWEGPDGAGWNGGVTFSMLSRFLCCRARFGAAYLDGWHAQDQFNHRISYGSMWHVCEEALAANADVVASVVPVWEPPLREYANGLLRKYPTSREQVQHWYNVCRTQFPLYAEYWRNNDQVRARTPLLQEQAFDVPYALPSGRSVRLRGKFDSVDLIGKGKGAAVYLQENKTKGDIDAVSIQTQLAWDMQTMLYLTALSVSWPTWEQMKSGFGGLTRRLVALAAVEGVLDLPGIPIAGVRYNVIRRPLSGGKGSIVRHKPTKSNPDGEGAVAFYERLGGVIRENAGEFFMRWQVEVLPADVERFRRETLDPLLEQLWDFYEERALGREVYAARAGARLRQGFVTPTSFRFPFGVNNMLLEGYGSDFDAFLDSGSTAGLERRDRLFSELEE